MAHLIVACHRESGAAVSVRVDLLRCADALAPDNIRPNPPILRDLDGLGLAVVNPVAGMGVHDRGLCVGRMFGQPEAWWELGADAPDGSYVIVRHDERTLELLTDVLATRQLWYVHTPQLFAASTSQRALVMLLRSFDLNAEAVAWMLADAHLGGASWDARLRRVRGDSRVVLERASWRLRVHEREAVREPVEASDADYVRQYRDALLDTCAGLDLPTDQWLLPLSGGMDSRGLLLALVHAGRSPRCVTWGVRAALLDPESDAFVARELAAQCGADFTYWPTDESPDSIETAMGRFLRASEGQGCEFGAYTDGMAMWKSFFEEGAAGVMRGDEPGQGSFDHYGSELQITRRWRLTLVSDYPEGHLIRKLGLPEQLVDDRLRRLPDEGLPAWCVRLYEDAYCPAKLAPLNTIKASYLDVVNPMQSRAVVQVARRLPERLRYARAPLRGVIRELGPDVPFATKGALGRRQAFWQYEAGAGAMVRALSADHAERVLGRPALELILAAFRQQVPSSTPRKRSLAKSIKGIVPKRVVGRLRAAPPLRLGPRELAFRAYVAVEAADLLARDAGLLG